MTIRDYTLLQLQLREDDEVVNGDYIDLPHLLGESLVALLACSRVVVQSCSSVVV